ncbi:MAG: formyltransferase family protein [Actinomycetota bacterium]
MAAADPPKGWRIVIISMVLPVVEPLVGYLRELGHEPVAWLMARRPPDDDRPLPPWGEITDRSAPQGLNLIFARDKHELAPLLRGLAPDLVLCWGFSWKIPQEALGVPRLGSVNHHPALLPRHRGPIPLAWALRENDGTFGLTWHRMDSELDTGAILSQTTMPIEDGWSSVEELGPSMLQASFAQLPEVFERLAAGDPGDPQSTEGVSWAGIFEDDDYAKVDWTHSACQIHDQVRAWHLTFGLGDVPGPIAELDGERVKLLRTSLTDPGNGERAVETGDGTLWIIESEPAE